MEVHETHKMQFGSDKNHEKSSGIGFEINEGLFSLPEEGGLESKKIVFQSDGEKNNQISQSQSPRAYSESMQSAEFKIEKLQSKIKELQSQIETLRKNPRKVSHITVYYDDSTFETFFPR